MFQTHLINTFSQKHIFTLFVNDIISDFYSSKVRHAFMSPIEAFKNNGLRKKNEQIINDRYLIVYTTVCHLMK